MLKAVVFDFDGVIVDSEEHHFASIIEALRPHQVPLGFKEFRATYTGHNDRSVILRIAATHGIAYDDAQIDSWRARKVTAYRAAVTRGVRPLPGASELVRATAKAMPIGLATGSRRSDVDAVLGVLDNGSLKDRFRITVTCDDVPSPKPHPQTYATAVERLGFSPTECLAIEDTPGGIASAKGAGLKVVAVAGTHGHEKLRQADRIINTLENVTVDLLKEWFESD